LAASTLIVGRDITTLHRCPGQAYTCSVREKGETERDTALSRIHEISRFPGLEGSGMGVSI